MRQRNSIRAARSCVLGLVLAFGLSVSETACGGSEKSIKDINQAERLPSGTGAAKAWREADPLFRQDGRWRGGDAAYSIDLGDQRFLWLFGDSFVAHDRAVGRKNATIIRNSIAVQTGADPSRASVKFYWRVDHEGSPLSFFPERGNQWLWPAHGILLDGELTLFLYRIVADHTEGSFGFRVAGWTAVRVTRLSEDPLSWDINELSVPDTGEATVVGAAAVQEDGYVYAFALTGASSQEIGVLRWTNTNFKKGDLSVFEWWGGPEMGWNPKTPATVIAEGVTEFSVSRLPGLPWWVQVQSRPVKADGEIGVRYAQRLTGPWTKICTIYRPPESGQRYVFSYAGKAHPQLRGADVVVTYVANSIDFSRVVSDTDIYFPRFIKITKPSLLQACPLPH
jgi:hypothetical protein